MRSTLLCNMHNDEQQLETFCPKSRITSRGTTGAMFAKDHEYDSCTIMDHDLAHFFEISLLHLITMLFFPETLQTRHGAHILLIYQNFIGDI
jgi:hypothetical protein